MKTIRYLMSLSPQKSLIASQMVAILFLATGWGWSEYNNNKAREKDKAIDREREREAAKENIKLWNRIVDGQTNRSDKLDSALIENRKALEHLKK